MSATPAPRRDIDKSRWPQLSPLLDELLDLDEPAARAARLAQLRAQDPALAEDLEELLARDAAMAHAPVLDSPVLAQLSQAPTLKPGQQLGPYTLEREIGQGGMGTVWLARRTDGRYEGQVAVKFLSSGLLGRGDSGRFAREGQILGRLAHPHIARLLDAGVAQEGGPPYLVLEYIDGQPIDRFCEQRALDVRSRVTLFLDVLAAVAHAHNRLILHRDLKPSNILVNQAGEVKLLDFGIAKLLGDATQPAAATELTQQAGRAFTPQYAAPEQVQGGDVTTATDVYALGVLLYLLLSGQHPTAGAIADDSPLARMKAVLEVEPRRLSEQARTLDARRARELRGDLDTIVARALKKAPAERYANAETMAADLKRWLAHEPILARPDSAGYRIAKFVRRHRIGVATGAAALLALSSLTVLSVAQAWRAERAERLAQQRSAQADDLLGYMLGELADKLRPIGRLELLASVGSKAMAHLSDAPADRAGSAQSVLQRAKALTVLGEVSMAKRELDQALVPLAAARRLLSAEPPDAAMAADWRKAQGTAAFWMGHAYYTKRQFAPAQEAWEAYRSHSAAWLAASPGQFEPMAELAYALSSLGTVQLDTGHLPEAAQQFQASLELKQQAIRLRPQDLTVLASWANTISWLGTAQLWQGQFGSAMALFSEGLEKSVAAQAAAPKDLEWSYRMALARTWLGTAREWMQQPAAALADYRAALLTMNELLKQDPKNRQWQQWRIKVETAAIENGLLGDGPVALQRLASMQEELRVLDTGASSSAALHRLPLRAQLSLAAAKQLTRQHRRDEAVQSLRQLMPQLREALAQRPDDLRLHIQSARTRMTLAGLLSPVDLPAAREQCRSTIDELSGLSRMLGIHFEITEAWVQAHSCLGQEEQIGRERAWLAQRINAGS